jgi:hypothetical protein
MSRSTSNPEKPRYIYFIRADGTNEVKIGTTRNPLQRLRGLQTANARCLTLKATVSFSSGYSADKYEAVMHERLKARALNGEWFNLPPSLLEREVDYLTRLAAGLLNDLTAPGTRKVGSSLSVQKARRQTPLARHLSPNRANRPARSCGRWVTPL